MEEFSRITASFDDSFFVERHNDFEVIRRARPLEVANEGEPRRVREVVELLPLDLAGNDATVVASLLQVMLHLLVGDPKPMNEPVVEAGALVPSDGKDLIEHSLPRPVDFGQVTCHDALCHNEAVIESSLEDELAVCRTSLRVLRGTR